MQLYLGLAPTVASPAKQLQLLNIGGKVLSSGSVYFSLSFHAVVCYSMCKGPRSPSRPTSRAKGDSTTAGSAAEGLGSPASPQKQQQQQQQQLEPQPQVQSVTAAEQVLRKLQDLLQELPQLQQHIPQHKPAAGLLSHVCQTGPQQAQLADNVTAALNTGSAALDAVAQAVQHQPSGQNGSPASASSPQQHPADASQVQPEVVGISKLPPDELIRTALTATALLCQTNALNSPEVCSGHLANLSLATAQLEPGKASAVGSSSSQAGLTRCSSRGSVNKCNSMPGSRQQQRQCPKSISAKQRAPAQRPPWNDNYNDLTADGGAATASKSPAAVADLLTGYRENNKNCKTAAAAAARRAAGHIATHTGSNAVQKQANAAAAAASFHSAKQQPSHQQGSTAAAHVTGVASKQQQTCSSRSLRKGESTAQRLHNGKQVSVKLLLPFQYHASCCCTQSAATTPTGDDGVDNPLIGCSTSSRDSTAANHKVDVASNDRRPVFGRFAATDRYSLKSSEASNTAATTATAVQLPSAGGSNGLATAASRLSHSSSRATSAEPRTSVPAMLTDDEQHKVQDLGAQQHQQQQQLVFLAVPESSCCDLLAVDSQPSQLLLYPGQGDPLGASDLEFLSRGHVGRNHSSSGGSSCCGSSRIGGGNAINSQQFVVRAAGHGEEQLPGQGSYNCADVCDSQAAVQQLLHSCLNFMPSRAGSRAAAAIAAAEDADCVLLGTLPSGLSQNSLVLMAAAAAAAIDDDDEHATNGAQNPSATDSHHLVPAMPMATAIPHLEADPAGVTDQCRPSFQVLQYSLDEEGFAESDEGEYSEECQTRKNEFLQSSATTGRW
jgi:hypothetical protein